MSRIYTPTQSADDWQKLLADPEKHWNTGFSARSVAYAGEEADGFPKSVQSVLGQSFPEIEPLIVLPEHKVDPPGGIAASQNDVWVLAKSGRELISIAVEGKVVEAFGPTVGEWNPDASSGRQKRFDLPRRLLQLDDIPPVTRYKLLHRTARSSIDPQLQSGESVVYGLRRLRQAVRTYCTC